LNNGKYEQLKEKAIKIRNFKNELSETEKNRYNWYELIKYSKRKIKRLLEECIVALPIKKRDKLFVR